MACQDIILHIIMIEIVVLFIFSIWGNGANPVTKEFMILLIPQKFVCGIFVLDQANLVMIFYWKGMFFSVFWSKNFCVRTWTS